MGGCSGQSTATHVVAEPCVPAAERLDETADAELLARHVPQCARLVVLGERLGRVPLAPIDGLDGDGGELLVVGVRVVLHSESVSVCACI